MAETATIQVEAKLVDQMSGALKAIQHEMARLEKTTFDSTKGVKSELDALRKKAEDTATGFRTGAKGAHDLAEKFDKVNNKMGRLGSVLGNAKGGLDSAGVATGAFGGALNALSLGPLGIAIAGITALNAGVNLLIDNAHKAAELKASMGATIKDPAQLERMIKASEKFDSASKMWDQAGASIRASASKDFAALTGENISDYRGRGGLDTEGLKRQKAALDKSLEFKKTHNDEYRKLENELAQARAQGIGDSSARALALENAHYEAEKKRLGGNKSALEMLEQVHAQKVANIRQESADKAATEEEKFASAVLKREADMKNKIREAHLKEQKEARDLDVKADEQRTEAIYKAREEKEKNLAEARHRVGVAEAGDDKTAKLQADHDLELALFKGTEEEKTALLAAQVAERDALRNAEVDQAIGAFGQMFGGLAALQRQASMNDRENRLRYKALAIAQATVNTYLAATQALSSVPYPFNLVAMAGVIATGLAQVMQIKDQKFASGTLSAPGGMALVGERGPELVELPRGSRVYNNTESRGMMRGGGVTHNGDVILQLAMPAGTTTAQAESLGAAAGRGYADYLKTLKRDIKNIDYMNIPDA